MKNKEIIVNLIDFNEQLRTYMIDQKPLRQGNRFEAVIELR